MYGEKRYVSVIANNIPIHSFISNKPNTFPPALRMKSGPKSSAIPFFATKFSRKWTPNHHAVKQSRTFCRVHEGNEKYSAVQAKTDASKSRDEPSSSQKRRRGEWSRYLFLFLFFSSPVCSLSSLARRETRWARDTSSNEGTSEENSRWKTTARLGGSAQYLGARGACKRRGMGITRSFVTGLFAYVARVFLWRQACKVQLNEPSLNIVWKITSVTRILFPPPLPLPARDLPSPFVLLRARLSLSFKSILLARHAWLVDSFLLLFLLFLLFFFFLTRCCWLEKKRVESRELLHLPIWLHVPLNLA